MVEKINPNLLVNQVSSGMPKSHFKGRLLAAAIVSLVVIGESTLAYLVFPPAQDTVALERDLMAAATEGQGGSYDVPRKKQIPLVEFPLGEAFSVSAFQPASNTTLRFDFQLFGLAKEEDHDEVISLHAKLERRFREQVIVTIRSAEIADVSEPGLGLIKRKILEKTNRAYGKPLLQDIIIPDFSFVEQ